MLIEFFSLGVTVEALRAIIGSKSVISLQRGPFDPEFQVEGMAPPTIFFLRKLAKCSFVWYKNLDVIFFRFVTIHAFDRQTDRQTDGRTERRNSYCSTKCCQVANERLANCM